MRFRRSNGAWANERTHVSSSATSVSRHDCGLAVWSRQSTRNAVICDNPGMKRLIVLGIVACSKPAPAPVQPKPQGAAMPHHDHDHHDHASHSMHHRFEKADEWAKQFDDPERDAWQQPDKVVAAMAIKPGMIVADVGAGTGYFEARLSKAVGDNGKVIAVDIEPDMVRYMNERRVRERSPNVEARLGKADDPDLHGVDRILIVDTWHHIDNREGYAKKLAAALNPGGMVFVVDFKLESEKGPPKEHRLAPEKVIGELAAAGFDGRVLDIGLPDQYVVSAAVK